MIFTRNEKKKPISGIGGCPHCGSKKRSGGAKDINTGVRTYVCKDCGKKFYTGGY